MHSRKMAEEYIWQTIKHMLRIGNQTSLGMCKLLVSLDQCVQLTIPIGKQRRLQCRTIAVQLLYTAVFNVESGKALLLLREMHLPS